MALSKDLKCWLKTFARAVRDRDFAAGTELFDRGIVAFGTVCPRAEGMPELLARQWTTVWPNTRDFEFAYPTARMFKDKAQATVIAGWRSTGVADNGSAFSRQGRATIVLRKSRSGWKAVHTHFSLNPSSGR